ncbi:ethanolamine ammonia-lyase reactivating factor EutA [Natrinema versiforme]|uniref:Reactivating factor for ethanolamine ammonia lyase n=1 Tax=Natrinema versiforme TaxID=88724 RepID=A0A4P8WH52_9EURY|nr:ethanolamine ammonia-lyase reactivating factor EutA [Natrinema versiforme]QCS42727.1 reactivating factor for ethanolamine ammonia lyase [Natrinema versiforme]
MPGADPETLSSIGIDIGTTTTQVIVSDLVLSAPTYNGAATVDVVERRVRYRSPIRQTPFAGDQEIDTDAVGERIDADVRKAGLTPDEIDTGAVIATGEAARKANAEALITRLAERTGEFVVATAGASLEAVLAGYGSGAGDRSGTDGSTIATVDIGGGTTNIAVFEDGKPLQTRCLDVGGRLVRFDDDGLVRAVAEPIRRCRPPDRSAIDIGSTRSDADWNALARRLADRVFDAIEGPPFDETTRALAVTDLPETAVDIDEVVFTGGVGRLVSDPAVDTRDPLEYGDLGVRLAAAIRTHERFDALPVRQSAEDIRATVIGAGTRTTTFTGRTIAPAAALLPARNLPVLALEGLEAADSVDAVRARTAAVLRTARNRRDITGLFALHVSSVGPLAYDRLRLVARGIAAACDARLDGSQPLVLLTEQNCAKVLGQLLESMIDAESVMVLDELAVTEDEYVDLGTPVAENAAVPVTIKTLVFDE